jgi:hypothetical protein
MKTNYEFLREHAWPAHRAAEVYEFLSGALGYLFLEYCDERAGWDQDHEDAKQLLLSARRESFAAVKAGEWQPAQEGELHSSAVVAA